MSKKILGNLEYQEMLFYKKALTTIHYLALVMASVIIVDCAVFCSLV